MNIPPILKNKWVLIGGGLVILIVLFMSAGGSSSASTASANGPSDAEVAAQHDITIAQLNAQVAQNGVNGQIALVQAQGQVDLARAGLDAQVSQYSIDAQNAFNTLQLNTSRDVQMADMASQERRDQAAISMQTSIAKWTLDQGAYMQETQQAFQLQYAEQANQTAISMQQMQANLVNNQLTASRDMTLAGLATQTDLAAINASLQRDVTYSNNTTQAAIYSTMTAGSVEQARIAAQAETERARLSSSAAKHGSTVGMIGSIIGGALSIFSDPALKQNIRKIGTEPDGLNLYEFEYLNGVIARGVMATEVAVLRPWALGPKVDGFLTVDYARLAA